MAQLIECVPNFSEGRDLTVIRQITGEIEGVAGVRLLDVDPGQATNRTVVTFVGPPDPVIEAAVRAARKAAELIDMSRHRGEHPRFGSTDVCPLVPVSGISMEETVELARKLGRRLGEEVGLTVYCYEKAALTEERRDLARVRSGEYEGLQEKLARPEWKPDFGPAEFNRRSGATAVGARDFLVAYNINLNTTSTRRANAVAFDVRERGRVKRRGQPLTGEIVRDAEGKPVYVPGSLKAVKGIGWFIEEYGIAQVSLNLTDIGVTPVHLAFEEVRRRAAARGMRVTGSELVGLIPLRAMLDAGRYYLAQQQRSLGIPDREVVRIAVRSLGLDDLHPFKPEEKIIEYLLADRDEKRLTDLTLSGFVEETASESAAPGGGSVAATLGALGAALGTMVANLSAHKRGWDERWEEFSDWAVRGRRHYEELLRLIDEDTRAFQRLMAAYRLPQVSEDEKAERHLAIQEATKEAMVVPCRILEESYAAMEVIAAMAEAGNPASVSDAGVGALCARAAVQGALMNVEINSAEVEDREYVAELLQRGRKILQQAEQRASQILATVERQLQQPDDAG